MPVGGSLQVGDINRIGLKESPSWSPAFLLAAMEWADEDAKIVGDSNSKDGFARKPFVPPSLLAQNTTFGRPSRPKRRTDDVNFELARGFMAGTPHDVGLPVNLNYRTPAVYKPYNPYKPYKPAPPTLSLDTTAKPLRSQPPLRSDLRSQYLRGQRQQQRQQEQQEQQQYNRHQPQQRNGGGQRRHRGDAQEAKAIVSVDQVAQLGSKTGRILPEEKKARSRQNMSQPMQPSAAPPSPMASPTASLSHRSRMFERVASLARPRKKSNVDSPPPKSTLTKRSRVLPISPISPTPTSSNGAFAGFARSDGLDCGSMPNATIKTLRGDLPTIDAPRGASNSAERVSGVRLAVYYS